MSKGLNELAKLAYESSKEKGFHDDDEHITPAHRLQLIVGEITETFEELRDNRGMMEIYFSYEAEYNGVKFKKLNVEQYEALTGNSVEDAVKRKPEGVPVEVADTLIRLFDFAGTYGIDIEKAVEDKMKFNTTRSFRHGRAF